MVALVVNGTFPKDSNIVDQIRSSEVIIATDGAANSLLKNNITPHYVVGDLDSIDSGTQDSVKHTINTPDQSKTDLEKALEWCVDNNYLSLSIFGISGKSEDHFLGNFFTINEFVDQIQCVIYTDYSIITPCVGENEFDSFAGQTVSLITLQNHSIVSSTNLEYPLDSYKLVPSSKAIRNKSLGTSFTIECSEPLMVFQTRK